MLEVQVELRGLRFVVGLRFIAEQPGFISKRVGCHKPGIEGQRRVDLLERRRALAGADLFARRREVPLKSSKVRCGHALQIGARGVPGCY